MESSPEARGRHGKGAGREGDQTKRHSRGNKSGPTALAEKHSCFTRSCGPEAEEILHPVLCRRSD